MLCGFFHLLYIYTNNHLVGVVPVVAFKMLYCLFSYFFVNSWSCMAHAEYSTLFITPFRTYISMSSFVILVSSVFSLPRQTKTRPFAGANRYVLPVIFDLYASNISSPRISIPDRIQSTSPAYQRQHLLLLINLHHHT